MFHFLPLKNSKRNLFYMLKNDHNGNIVLEISSQDGESQDGDIVKHVEFLKDEFLIKALFKDDFAVVSTLINVLSTFDPKIKLIIDDFLCTCNLNTAGDKVMKTLLYSTTKDASKISTLGFNAPFKFIRRTIGMQADLHDSSLYSCDSPLGHTFYNLDWDTYYDCNKVESGVVFTVLTHEEMKFGRLGDFKIRKGDYFFSYTDGDKSLEDARLKIYQRFNLIDHQPQRSNSPVVKWGSEETRYPNDDPYMEIKCGTDNHVDYHVKLLPCMVTEEILDNMVGGYPETFVGLTLYDVTGRSIYVCDREDENTCYCSYKFGMDSFNVLPEGIPCEFGDILISFVSTHKLYDDDFMKYLDLMFDTFCCDLGIEKDTLKSVDKLRSELISQFHPHVTPQLPSNPSAVSDKLWSELISQFPPHVTPQLPSNPSAVSDHLSVSLISPYFASSSPSHYAPLAEFQNVRDQDNSNSTYTIPSESHIAKLRPAFVTDEILDNMVDGYPETFVGLTLYDIVNGITYICDHDDNYTVYCTYKFGTDELNELPEGNPCEIGDVLVSYKSKFDRNNVADDEDDIRGYVTEVGKMFQKFCFDMKIKKIKK
jgi:hypothetical protein